MNAPFSVAQVVSAPNSAAAPKIVKVTKPADGQAITVQMDGSVKLDLTAIASEKITLVRVGERLTILFENKSTVTIDPFFDSSGRPLQGSGIELETNRIISGEEFATLFPITDDQSVLPAAGEQAAAAQNTGSAFGDPSVDPLASLNPLDLLPAEELGNWVSEDDATPLLDPEPDLVPFLTGARLRFTVEEEHALPTPSNEMSARLVLVSGGGNEDPHDGSEPSSSGANADGHDQDTTGQNDNTTREFHGTGATGLTAVISGGTPPLSFFVFDRTGDEVKTEGSDVITSAGTPVVYGNFDNGVSGQTSIDGIADGVRVFTLTIETNGDWTFTLYGKLDHPFASNDDGTIPQGALEELLGIDLTSLVQAVDGNGSTLQLSGTGYFVIDVIDDTPIMDVANPQVGNGFDFGEFAVHNQWGAGSGVNTPADPAGGSAGAWQFGSTDGGPGSVQLERVGDGYLGMHSSTGGYMVDMDATANSLTLSQTLNLAPGETYQLSFEAGAPMAGTAHLEVWFGGFKILDIDPTVGSMQNYLVALQGGSGDGSNLLEFRETGPDDNHGTYLANVHLVDVILDETAGADQQSNDDAALASIFATVSEPGVDADRLTPEYAQGTKSVVDVYVSFGADGAHATDSLAFSLKLVSEGANSGLKTTEGKAILLFTEGDFVVGRFDSNNDGDINELDENNAAFALHVNDNGVLQVAEFVSLQHPNTNNHDEGVYLNGDLLSVTVTARDGDNDAIIKSVDISKSIRFEDDGPSLADASGISGEVDEDALLVATDGNEDNGRAGETDIPGAASVIFSGSVGSLNSLVNFGADGAGETPFKLVSVQAAEQYLISQNLTSGDSAINDITISGNKLTASSEDGRDIFTLTINNDGSWSFELLDKIDHPITLNPDAPNNNAFEDTISVSLGGFIDAYDGDGDHANMGGAGLSVTIRDDIPFTPGAAVNLIKNGIFEDGTWSAPEWWGSAATQADHWTITGGSNFERVPDGFLDMFTSNGEKMIDMAGSPGNLTISQTIAGMQADQTYAIQFEAGAPFPETAKLEVLWNGVVIGTIEPTGPGALTSYNFIVTGSGNPADNKLTFREVGQGSDPISGNWQGHGLQNEGYHGTYIANVAAVPVFVVDEDGLPTGNGDTQLGDAATNDPFVTGALNISWGADNHDGGTDTVGADGHFTQDGSGRSVVFTDSTVGISGGELTSKGDAITIALSADGTKLIGSATHDNVTRTVFEVTLSDDDSGKFHFVLHDQLDHAPGASENDITLTFHYTATDSDGDLATGSFLVGVDDDMPVVTAEGVTLTVNENDIRTPWSQGTSPNTSPGIPDSQSKTENNPGNVDPAKVSGSVASLLVGGGADDNVTYAFTDQALSYFQSLQLFSKQTANPENGVALQYSITQVGNILILSAYEPNVLGDGIDGSNPVFEFRLNTATGQFEFRLFDELIHVEGEGENTDLRSGGPGYYDVDGDTVYEAGEYVGSGTTGSVGALDFGKIISATDHDGDSVTFDGKLLIEIKDDVPEAKIKLTGEKVIHDETPGDDGNHDTNSSNVKAKFAYLEAHDTVGADPDVAPNGAGAIGYAHNNDAIVQDNSDVGADSPAHERSFSLKITDAASGLKVTDGSDITLEMFDNGTPGDPSDDLIIGRVTGGQFAGQIAFAIAIDGDGEISIAQYLSLRHDDVNDHDESNDNGQNSGDDPAVNESPNPIQQTLDGKISAVLTVTDSDGDTDTAEIGIGSKIVFEDDGPKISIRTDDGKCDGQGDDDIRLTLDESIGAMAGDSNANSDVVAGVTQPSLLLAPDSTKAIGSMSTPSQASQATSVSDLFNVTFTPGADGAAGPVEYNYSLTLKDDRGNTVSNGSSTGVKTNLVVTNLDGTNLENDSVSARTVWLFKQADGSIIGKIGIGSNDPNYVALRIIITGSASDPQITVEQYLPIEHQNGGSNHDDSIYLKFADDDASLGITLSVKGTDGDGDYATDTETVTLIDDRNSFIKIEDDGPSITVTAAATEQEIAALKLNLDESVQRDGATNPSYDRYNAGESADNNGGADDVDVQSGPGINYIQTPVVATNPSSSNELIGRLKTPVGALGALFAIGTPDYGTDGAATSNEIVHNLTLELSGNSPFVTNLKVTALDGTALENFSEAARTIRLVKTGNIIEGRIQGASSGGSDDYVAFRITIENASDPANARLVVEQFLPIDHGSDNPSLFDETAILNLLNGDALNLKLTTTVTDGDGDTASSSATVTLIDGANSVISFDDDGPTVSVTASASESELAALFRNMDETVRADGSSNNNFDRANSPEAHDSNGGADDVDPGAPNLDFNQTPVVSTTPTAQQAIGRSTSGSGALDDLFSISLNYGTDGKGSQVNALSFVLSAAAVQTTLQVTALDNPALKTLDAAQRTIYLVKVSDTVIEGRVIGADDVVDNSDVVAIRFTINNAGNPGAASITIDQFLPIDHGADNPSLFDEQAALKLVGDGSLAIRLTSTVTDGDGDVSSSHADVNLITGTKTIVAFDDDGPTAPTITAATTGVVLDETAGAQSATPIANNATDPSGDGNDVSGGAAGFGSYATVAAIFAGVPNPGDDPHVASNPIGYAVSGGSLVGSVIGGAFGTDGAALTGSVAYGFVVSSGAASGLRTTEGSDIFLYNGPNGLILGRVGTEAGAVDTANANGDVAFALAIDPATGKVYVAQYLSLENPTPGVSHDEAAHLANDSVKVQVTYTDGDGDKAQSAPVNVGQLIGFEDDGPQVFGVAPTTYGPELIQNGSFEAGHGLAANDWEIFSGITGWGQGSNDIPFEVHTNGAAGFSPHSGNSYIELDGDTQGNPDNAAVAATPGSGTNATIQQTITGLVAGQEYELSFWYSPRGGEGTGNSGMDVSFGGVPVYSIPNANTAPGWVQHTVTFTATGPSAVLAFTGTGAPNEFGAFLDDVSLKAVNPPLDDEDTTLNPATEIQGGPGDDGAGKQLSGKILFDAGADGLKSIAVAAMSGLTGIHVNDSGIGHAYTINQVWNAGVDANGNATGYEKGGTLFGTMTTDEGVQPAFTIEVKSDGTYVFTLTAPLNHPYTDQDSHNDGLETSWEDNLTLGFGFTITDGDGDTATGTIVVNVDDDSPEATYQSVSAAVSEGDITVLPGELPQTTFNFAGTVINSPVAAHLGPNLTANASTLGTGHDSAWGLNAPIVISATNNGNPFVLESVNIGVAGPNQPMTVLINGYDATNTLVASQSFVVSGPTSLGDPLTSLFDGGTGPLSFDGKQIVRLEFISQTPNTWVQIDNLVVGMGTPLPGEIVPDQATVDLDTLAIFGADGQHATGGFHLTTFGPQAFGTIHSDGDQVFIKSDGNVLTGYTADNAKLFTLEIVNGEAVFKLYGELDHNQLDSLALNFGDFITATDSDGDKITLPANAVVFNIEDGTTPLEQSAAFGGLVEEEHLQPNASGAYPITAIGNEDENEGPLAPPNADQDVSPDFDATTNQVINGSFNVTGGDGDPTLAFTNAIEGTIVKFADGSQGNVTSGGETVRFHYVSPTQIIGYADAGGDSTYASGTDRVVFSMEINDTTNSYTFTLFDKIDHHLPANADHQENTRAIDLDGLVIASEPGVSDIALNGSVVIIDDVPEFVSGGIADQSVGFAAVTHNLNLSYGADGEGSTFFSRLPDLSAFGITYVKDDATHPTEVTAKLPNGETYFTIKLNGDGTYTFDLGTLPEVSESGFQGVSFNGGFDPEPVKDFSGFKLLNGRDPSNNSTVINGSGVGFGVGSNAQIEDGEKFEVLFDAPMTNATFGVRHNGGGELALTWIAYDINGNQVGTGTVHYDANGSLPTGNLPPFIKLVITADGDHNAHLRISSIDGDIAGDPDDLEHLSFEVTGVDGDGDSVSDAFDIDINLISPLVQSAAFDGMVEEEHLQPNASGAYPITAIGNEDGDEGPLAPADADGDVLPATGATTNQVINGSFNVAGGDGDPTLFFTNAINNAVVKFADGSQGDVTSGGQTVRFHYVNPTLIIGYADAGGDSSYVSGTDRVVFSMEINDTTNSYTFTLFDKIDHHPAGDNQENTREINLNGLVIASEPGVSDIVLNGKVTVIDDVPVAAANVVSAPVATLDESYGSSATDPNAYVDDVYNDPLAFGRTTIAAATIEGLFTASAGADGKSGESYSLQLHDGTGALIGNNSGVGVVTNLSVVDFANAFSNDTITLYMQNGEIVGRLNGSDNGPIALKIKIDTATHVVTIEQYQPISHPTGGTSHDEEKLLEVLGGLNGGIFVGYGLQDNDGDSVQATSAVPLVISIEDDGITAWPDTDSFGNALIGTSISGNVISGFGTDLGIGGGSGDDIGMDRGGVSHIVSDNLDGSPAAVGTGGATIAGQYGNLTINPDGTYTYTRTSASAGNDVFTYTLKDGDGDTSSATLTIKLLQENGFPLAATVSVVADEDNLLVANGALFDGNNNADSAGDDAQANLSGSLGSYGTDGAGNVSFASLSGNFVQTTGLASVQTDGAPLRYFWDGSTNTLYGSTDTSSAGQAAATASFKLVIDQATVGYQFTLLKHLDHASGNSENDIDLSLPFVITDSNGDPSSGVVAIKIDDDMPVVNLGIELSLNEDDLTGGNDVPPAEAVATSGAFPVSFGADGGSLSLSAPQATWDPGTKVLAANDGTWTFTVNSNGTYTFTLEDNTLQHGPGNNGENALSFSITVTATDGDGDTVTGAIDINIVDDVPVVTALNVAAPSIVLDETIVSAAGPVVGGNNADDDDVSGVITVGGPNPFGRATIAAASIAGLFSTSAGADGLLAASFGLVLKNSAGAEIASNSGTGVSTNLSVIGGGNIVLFHEGNEIVGRVSSAAGSVAIKASIDAGTGEVKIEQFQPVAHASGGTDHDDIASLLVGGSGGIFVSHSVTDGDGDIATAISNAALTVSIEDDGIDARIDTDSFGNGATGTSITGNVIDGTGTNEGVGGSGTDAIGVDGGSLTAIQSNNPGGSGLTAVGAGGVTIDGQYGSLTINPDGSYTYTRTSTSAGNDVFTYTLTDGDGDTDTATLTINLLQANGLPTVNAVSIVADEDNLLVANGALFNGNNDTGLTGDDAQSGMTGTLGSYGTDGKGVNGGASFVGMTGDVLDTNTGDPVQTDGVTLQYYWHAASSTLYASTDITNATTAANTASFKIEVNQATLGYEFTLLKHVDHPTDNSENDVDLKLNFTITDGNSDTTLGTVSIKIDDDMPVAAGEIVNTIEGGQETVNLVIVLDRSGSMDDNPDGPGGFASRLALAKAALENLIETANVNQVLVVGFAGSASAPTDVGGSSWRSPADALTFINNMIADGNTDYDAALSAVYSNYAEAHTAADKTFAFFLSDGEPNESNGTGSDGIVGSEIQTWQNFIINNNIDQAFAIGIGTGVNVNNLQPLAYPNGDPTNPITIVNETDLIQTLTGVLPGTAQGNVLTNDGFGADGGRILSIVVETAPGVFKTYAFNGTNIQEGVNTIAGDTLTVTTAIGGQLIFHFGTSNGFDAGDFSYVSPANVTDATDQESFLYTLIDGDGDQAAATLQINIDPNTLPVAGDDTVSPTTPGSVVTIPFASLLANDSDADGHNVLIYSVHHMTGGTAIIDGTNIVFTPSSGPASFQYTIIDGFGGEATATVNVNYPVAPLTDLNGVGTGSGNTAAFIEQTPILIAPNGAVTDTDSNIQSMTVTLASRPDGNNIESLSLNAIAQGVATTAGLTVGYTSTTGVLLITGAAAASTYQSILQGIQYNNTSDNPGTANRTVNVVVQDASGLNSTSNAVTIGVTPVNDEPTIADAGNTLAYTENGSAARIDSSVTVGDVDSQNFNGGKLTISITNNGTLADILSIVENGSGSTRIDINGNSLRYGGTGSGDEIGTFTGGTNGNPLVITFNDNAATAAAIERLIESIGFSNSSDDPSTLARTITYTLVDGDGTANGGTDTVVGTATVNVTAVNDAPDAVNDGIRVNVAPVDGTVIKIPEWVLMLNDSDPENNSLDVTAVSSPSDLASVSLATNPGFVTITNNNASPGNDTDWGSFTYTLTDSGGAADTATVSIDHDASGALDGTNGANILVNLLTTGVTMNGNNGNDYLIGNVGADILNGGNDNDFLYGGAGNDTLSGGSGADTFAFGAGDYGSSNRDAITDFSDSQGDKLDLTGLLDVLYGGNQTSGNVQVVGSGSNAIVQVDTNIGAGTTWQDVAVLSGYNSSGSDQVDIVLNNMTNQTQTYTA